MEEAPNIGRVTVGAIEAQGGERIVARRRKVAIDRGVGVGRCAPRRSRIRFEAANGTENQQYDNRTVAFQAGGVGRNCEMELLTVDVAKLFAPVPAIADAGNKAVFAKSGSYIRTLAIGETIDLRRQTVHTRCMGVWTWARACICFRWDGMPMKRP